MTVFIGVIVAIAICFVIATIIALTTPSIDSLEHSQKVRLHRLKPGPFRGYRNKRKSK